MSRFIKESFELKETVLNEMARIGKFDDLEVYVRTNDGGNIPHMHIWDSTTRGSRFHTCIRLDKAEYFHHTGKEDKLNSRQRKDLVNLLQAPYRRFNITNWERLLIEWNDNNSDIIIDENSPMPNYLEL